MAGLLAERLRMAFKEKGVQIPNSTRTGKKNRSAKIGLPAVKHPIERDKAIQQTSLIAPSKINRGEPSDIVAASKGQPPIPHSQAPQEDKTVPSYTIGLQPSARIALTLDQQEQSHALIDFLESGRSTQCATGTLNDERIVVLGMDFGTSSIKVVIGDSALGKAFAVPFQAGDDLARYLLPSCLYETDGQFSLLNGQRAYRDLKLSLIANPTDLVLRDRVSAVIALVIRHARGWLFKTHADVYARTKLLWKLSVGLPIAYHLDDELTQTFSEAAHLAWLAACSLGEISVASLKAALVRKRIIKDRPEATTLDEDIDVSVVPEIAAQIYGFVNSSRFNRRDQNIYLMVDVGAGSVDSSLFYVKPAQGGRWDFGFYTSIVEPHGVMNLHRHRISWWRQALTCHHDAVATTFAEQLEKYKYPTDLSAALPDSFKDYLSDTLVTFQDPTQDPDETFFFKKVFKQVCGRSYRDAVKVGLPQGQLTDIPVFYCGGGMRMGFYGRLQSAMLSVPGCSWARAQPKRVELPKNLVAPGLRRSNFDRMTVAYGLSFLEIGQVTKVLPLPMLITEPVSSWTENYIDKDQC